MPGTVASLSTFAPLLQEDYSRHEPGQGGRRKKKRGKKAKRRLPSEVNKTSRIVAAMTHKGY